MQVRSALPTSHPKRWPPVELFRKQQEKIDAMRKPKKVVTIERRA